MRCSCQHCDTYMTHAESMTLGCVCPNCGNRCRACLGTNSVISRESLRHFKDDPSFAERMFAEPEVFEPQVNPDEYGRE